MGQNDVMPGQGANRSSTSTVVTLVLWLISVGLALMMPFALRELLVWGLALAIPQPDTLARLQAASAINYVQDCGIIIFAVIGFVIAVYTSERVFRHLGDSRLVRTLI